MVTAPRTNRLVSQSELRLLVSKPSYRSTCDTGALTNCWWPKNTAARLATTPEMRSARLRKDLFSRPGLLISEIF
jgi:hypothetical protein